ncbi:MBL fold metallo-hydrolase [Mumia sp. Pv 4-285]|uniref:MBL fold metallo-hydrolase n=1 Tax=Mumia qirimensis TaxID=3234852 RepID=UPI00351CCC6D
MCDVISNALSSVPDPGRRRFLKVLGASAAVGALATAVPSAAAGAPAHRRGRPARTRLVLLGTAGGPAYVDATRAGVSTAVVFEDRVYVVDLGLGAFQRLAQSGLGPDNGLGSALTNVRGVFFTHLHSDHTVDWPGTYVTGSMNATGRTDGAIQVFGPGRRDTLPRVFPPNRPAPALVSPDDPTPGISGMTGYLRQAFAQDVNDRLRDSNFTAPDAMFDVHDIDLSGVWTVDPLGKPPRLDAPIPVWEDGDVRITATLVDHHPTAPAFAYRFDTPDGSVVVSGDTTVSENLIDLAQDCDYLVHEVIDPVFVDDLTAALPADVGPAVREHLLGAHTTIEQVGRDVAEPAGAKNLVLSHMVPGANPMSRWRKAQRGYSGRLVVGEDLMELPVGRRRA